MKKKEVLYEKSATPKLHVSQGNDKIGKMIWSFSTLPGNEDHLLYIEDKEHPGEKILLTDVPGTCSKHCETCFNCGCYAVNSAKLHHNAVIQAWADNTLLLKSGKVFDMLDAFISDKNKNPENPKITIFRINVSGEIADCAELIRWNELAEKHPEVRFGVYTKNYEALDELCNTSGADSIAKNLVINVSEWHAVAAEFLKKHPGVFNVFEYDDSQRKNNDLSPEEVARLASTIHCPAVTAKGGHAKKSDGTPITCSMCQRCYRKTGEVTAVYAH